MLVQTGMKCLKCFLPADAVSQPARLKWWVKLTKRATASNFNAQKHLSPFSAFDESISSSLGFVTCVIMDVLSMETRC